MGGPYGPPVFLRGQKRYFLLYRNRACRAGRRAGQRGLGQCFGQRFAERHADAHVEPPADERQAERFAIARGDLYAQAARDALAAFVNYLLVFLLHEDATMRRGRNGD